MNTEPLLVVEDLVVEYPAKGFRKKPFRALKGVSIDIHPGECVGLVGESGSGKTTLGRAVLGLAPVTEGKVLFKGQDISHLGRKDRRKLSDEIQVVFQDPYSSLNPSLTIEQTLAEPLKVKKISSADASRRIRGLLDQVGLPSNSATRLPAGVLGWSAAAHRHRASPCAGARADRLRRARLGARPVDPGTRPRPLQGHPGGDRGGVPLRLARSRRRSSPEPPRRGDVSRGDRRVRGRRQGHQQSRTTPTLSDCFSRRRCPIPRARRSGVSIGDACWRSSGEQDLEFSLTRTGTSLVVGE